MRKWITEKLTSDELWLSYWPSLFTLVLNLGMLVSNWYFPLSLKWLGYFVDFMLCFGASWSIRGIYICYTCRKDIKESRNAMDQFMKSLRPEIQRILDEEMNVESRNDEEAMREAQRKIQELIQSESDRRKIGLRVSSSDKPYL